MRELFALLLILFLLSCDKNTKNNPENYLDAGLLELNIKSNPEGEEIVQRLEQETGSVKRETASVYYRFQNRNYRIERNCGWFEFLHESPNVEQEEIIKMDNIELIQVINNITRRDLADSTKLRLARHMKLKLFLMEMPFGLNSPTVQKEFLNQEKIKEQNLSKIKIEWIEDNYEKPYKVESVIWVDEKANDIAYIAMDLGDENNIFLYEPFNKREIEGIVFMDYHKYSGKKNKFSLEEMGRALDKNKLEEKPDLIYSDIRVSVSEKDCN